MQHSQKKQNSLFIKWSVEDEITGSHSQRNESTLQSGAMAVDTFCIFYKMAGNSLKQQSLDQDRFSLMVIPRIMILSTCSTSAPPM